MGDVVTHPFPLITAENEFAGDFNSIKEAAERRGSKSLQKLEVLRGMMLNKDEEINTATDGATSATTSVIPVWRRSLERIEVTGAVPTPVSDVSCTGKGYSNVRGSMDESVSNLSDTDDNNNNSKLQQLESEELVSVMMAKAELAQIEASVLRAELEQLKGKPCVCKRRISHDFFDGIIANYSAASPISNGFSQLSDDSQSKNCPKCQSSYSIFRGRKACFSCGGIFCESCSFQTWICSDCKVVSSDALQREISRLNGALEEMETKLAHTFKMLADLTCKNGELELRLQRFRSGRDHAKQAMAELERLRAQEQELRIAAEKRANGFRDDLVAHQKSTQDFLEKLRKTILVDQRAEQSKFGVELETVKGSLQEARMALFRIARSSNVDSMSEAVQIARQALATTVVPNNNSNNSAIIMMNMSNSSSNNGSMNDSRVMDGEDEAVVVCCDDDDHVGDVLINDGNNNNNNCSSVFSDLRTIEEDCIGCLEEGASHKGEFDYINNTNYKDNNNECSMMPMMSPQQIMNRVDTVISGKRQQQQQ